MLRYKRNIYSCGNIFWHCHKVTHCGHDLITLFPPGSVCWQWGRSSKSVLRDADAGQPAKHPTHWLPHDSVSEQLLHQEQIGECCWSIEVKALFTGKVLWHALHTNNNCCFKVFDISCPTTRCCISMISNMNSKSCNCRMLCIWLWEINPSISCSCGVFSYQEASPIYVNESAWKIGPEPLEENRFYKPEEKKC